MASVEVYRAISTAMVTSLPLCQAASTRKLAPLFMSGLGQTHDHDLPTSMDRKPPAGQGGQRIVSYHSARAQRPPAISTAQQHPTGRAEFAAPPKLHRIQARPVPR